MMSVGWRGPFFSNAFGELTRLRKEMNRLLDSYSGAERGHFGVGVFPPVNVFEDGNSIYVVAELPGVDPNELDISVQGDSLTLRGERVLDIEGEESSYHRRERPAGKFSRTITLPDTVNTDKVQAAYKLGILKITLPKAEEAKPRKISVTTA